MTGAGPRAASQAVSTAAREARSKTTGHRIRLNSWCAGLAAPLVDHLCLFVPSRHRTQAGSARGDPSSLAQLAQHLLQFGQSRQVDVLKTAFGFGDALRIMVYMAKRDALDFGNRAAQRSFYFGKARGQFPDMLRLALGHDCSLPARLILQNNSAPRIVRHNSRRQGCRALAYEHATCRFCCT